jgi:hypothetical protein
MTFISPGTIFKEFLKVVGQYRKGASGRLVWVIGSFATGLVIMCVMRLLA